jgi:hypothetical protein
LARTSSRYGLPAPAIWSARRSLSGSVNTRWTPLVTGEVATISAGSRLASRAIRSSAGCVDASVATRTDRRISVS